MRKSTISIFGKVVAIALSASLLMTSCSTATEKNANSTSAPNEPVTLEWYTLVNSIMPDTSMMTAEAQRYIKEKTNVTVNFHLYAWGDYGTTVTTMLNSGTNMDIVEAVAGVDYTTFAQRNAFVALDDYLNKDCPKTVKLMPKIGWTAMKVNGKTYGIPAQKDLAVRDNFECNQTLLDELGLKFPEFSTMNDLVSFLEKAKAERDKRYPDKAKIPLIDSRFASFENIENLGSVAYANIPNLPGCSGKGNGETAYDYYETSEYRNDMKTLRKLVKDGIMPAEDNFDQDNVYKQSGILLGNFGSGLIYEDENINAPYYKTKLYTSKISSMTTASFTGGPQCISSKCKYPEKALQVLELVNSDQHLATTLRFGVEGKHWTDKNNDNIIEDGPRNADTSNRGWYTWYGWQFGGLFVSKVPQGNPSNFSELLQQFNNNASSEANIGFTLDTSKIKNEIAACNNVINEYSNTLLKGRTDNVDQLVDQFIAKLKANGSEKILAEVQTQLTAWRKSNGKS